MSTDFSVQSPTHITSKSAEGEYYDDLITQFGPRLSPPKVVDNVQEAIEALNALSVQGPQGAQGPQGIQGPQGVQGAQGPQGSVAGATGVSGAVGPIAFSNAGFTNIVGYPTVTIPAGASGAVFYVEAGFSPEITFGGPGNGYITGVINHSILGNLSNTQKSVNITSASGMTIQYDINLSTILRLPAGTLTVAGNTGGSNWNIDLPTIQFLQIST